MIDFTGCTFSLAPQDNIDKHAEGVDAVLVLIDCPEALVTDESQLSDFSPSAAAMRALSNYFKRIVHVSEYLWQLAKEWEESR